RESPQPDGTPPMQPPRAWLAAEGIVTEVDTLKKLMTLQVQTMVFHDKEYPLSPAVEVPMDLKIASIQIDSIAVPMSKIMKGDGATAVSYADAMKRLIAKNGEDGASLIHRFPKPVPIDEVYLKRKDLTTPSEKPKAELPGKSLTAREALTAMAFIIVILLLAAIGLPSLIYSYYKIRYRYAKDMQKPYWAYKISTFYLHQIGIFRKDETPMRYALHTIDPKFDTGFSGFMNLYLKQKYAGQPLTDPEMTKVKNFIAPFIKTVKAKTSFRNRFLGFIHPLRSISYFVRPEEEE
ncbi:MAG TPA: hypothetical protein VFM90_10080, partial [Cyclobacteriaceae bacterium]|nr:hypothetical protein [Cyclobacteriaceae bacterium]